MHHAQADLIKLSHKMGLKKAVEAYSSLHSVSTTNPNGNKNKQIIHPYKNISFHFKSVPQDFFTPGKYHAVASVLVIGIERF